jgi:3-dehydroquinate synthase
MSLIRVAHDGANYDVVVGPFAEALPRLAILARGRRLPLITDERVFQLYGGLLADVALPDPVLVPEGEAAKDWQTLSGIVSRLAAMDIKRGTPMIALGGGAVGDVAGLAASLFKRGCPIVHVPTTLLAQADSAIGGKTAIDAAGQKNLVGSFHHPMLVLADPALLATLDPRQLRSGYAEIVKYALIDDPSFFAWCEAHGAAVIGGDLGAQTAAVEHCVRAKARFISEDPDDTTGQRALLNFGHTFGHAIEALAGTKVLHGEAIAVGMSLAFQYSERLELCPSPDVRRVLGHLSSIGLPTNLSDVGLADRSSDLISLMAEDKKAGRCGLALVLTKGIGKAFVQRDANQNALRQFLESLA